MAAEASRSPIRMPLEPQEVNNDSNNDNVDKITASKSKMTKTQYRCDVCKVRAFPTLAEACQHEEECRAQQEQQKAAKDTAQGVHESEESPTKKRKTDDAAVAVLDDDDNDDDDKVEILADPPPVSPPRPAQPPIKVAAETGGNWLSAAAAAKGKKKAPTKTTTTTTTRKRTTRSSAAAPKEGESSLEDKKPSKAAKKKKKKAPAPAAVHSFFNASSYAKASSAGSGTAKKAETTVVPKAAEQVTKKMTPPATKKTAAPATKKTAQVTKKTGTSRQPKQKTKKKSEAPFAPLFVEGADQDTLMAEHVAAEFQAKRRLKQQQERERQARRQQALGQLQQPRPQQQQQQHHHHQQHRQGSIAATKRKPKSSPVYCRFPNPSHVHPADDDRSSANCALPAPCAHWWTEETRLQAQTALQRAWLPGSEPPPVVESTTACPRLRSDPSSQDASILQETFQFETLVNLLHPPPLDPSSSIDNMLWTDKYSFASDSETGRPCGASLQDAFKTLKDLVVEWKVERQKANERMAERQRALAASSKSHKQRVQKKRARKKQCHDDFDEWMDSDEEQEDSGLSSLCLITGNVASGKTSLVHAVARHADCQVLEINTLQKRGAAALRKVLEEATQSHSSLDMLKKRQASIFATEQLVDTDDENDESAPAKGSNVTIVLLDEVDLLYEEDNGFWTALSDVTKHAKSPVILTANHFPDEMHSSAFHYSQIAIERPTPDECVLYLRHILQREGFSISEGKEETLDQELLLLAEFYSSDLRRLCYELQLMLSGSKRSSPQCNEMVPSPVPEHDKKVQEEKATTLPMLEGIKPMSAPSSQFSLVTITGSGFLSLATSSSKSTTSSKDGYPVSVEIGNQFCPEARIMDDSTILAVVPPCQSRPDVDASGNFCCTNRRCLTACYAPVQVHGVDKVGLLSSTAGMVTTTELVDGTKVASLSPVVNLEYHMMARKQTEVTKSSLKKYNDGSSDSEAEFEGSNPPPTAPKQPAVSISSDNQKIIDTLLQEGLTAWHSTRGNAADVEMRKSEPNGASLEDSAAKDMDSMYQAAYLASDAAFLEEGAVAGIPHLSGAVRGFGFELTDAFPQYNNQKSKFPSEESLFASGWKDNAFFHGCSNAHVCLPVGRRERRLTQRSERTLRGQAFRRDESQQDPVEDEEGDVIFWENSEEDMYLANSLSHSLSLLPSYLRTTAADKAGGIGAKIISQDPLFDRKKLTNMENATDMFEQCDSLFDAPWLKLFAPQLSRHLDPILDATEMLDKRIFLDYLPLLRCMAVLERAADAASGQEDPLSQDSSEGSSYQGRRVTRRSRQRGRVHYFEQAFECFQTTGLENTHAKTVGDMFAAALLQKE